MNNLPATDYVTATCPVCGKKCQAVKHRTHAEFDCFGCGASVKLVPLFDVDGDQMGLRIEATAPEGGQPRRRTRGVSVPLLIVAGLLALPPLVYLIVRLVEVLK